MKAQAGFIWTRRFAVSTVIVLLSLAGHSVGSVMLPSPAGFAVAVLLTAALTLTVRAGTSSGRLFGILLGAQALLHAIFVVSSDSMPMAGHAASLVPSAATVVGHVVASALAVAVLRYGDQVLSGWTELLTSAFGAPVVALPAIPVARALRVGSWDADAFSADTHLTSQVRRGPPTA